MTPISVSASEGSSAEGKPIAILGITGGNFDVSVWIPAEEAVLFDSVRSARWEQRGSIRIGQSAGAPVFWSSDEQTLSILIGVDDESWDIGFSLPASTLDSITDAIHSIRGWLSPSS